MREMDPMIVLDARLPGGCGNAAAWLQLSGGRASNTIIKQASWRADYEPLKAKNKIAPKTANNPPAKGSIARWGIGRSRIEFISERFYFGCCPSFI
jgi:hypothetical protein